MQQPKDRKQSPRETSSPSSGGVKGESSSKLKNIIKSISPVSTRKYAGHSGIRFQGKLKQTVTKGVCLDAESETDKVPTRKYVGHSGIRFQGKLKETVAKSGSLDAQPETDKVSTRKYAGHSGIKFQAKLKETAAKGVSLDPQPEIDKENPDFDVSPVKSDDARKDGKSAPASKEIKTKAVGRLQLPRERGDGPQTRSVTRQMLAAVPPSKIPKEGKSSVLSSKATKPSNVIELSSAANTLPPLKPYSGHTGMKFLKKPKSQTVVKPFNLGKKSPDANPSTSSVEEQQPEKSKDEMEYVPSKITKRRNAVD